MTCSIKINRCSQENVALRLNMKKIQYKYKFSQVLHAKFHLFQLFILNGVVMNCISSAVVVKAFSIHL